MSDNQKITTTELNKIRGLDDFDLTMLISEINDFDWPSGREILRMRPEGIRAKLSKGYLA